MTAQPNPQPAIGTRVKWSLKPGQLPSATTALEIEEAASDNFGVADGVRSYWFLSYSMARGFMTRIRREVPEAEVSVIL